MEDGVVRDRFLDFDLVEFMKSPKSIADNKSPSKPHDSSIIRKESFVTDNKGYFRNDSIFNNRIISKTKLQNQKYRGLKRSEIVYETLIKEKLEKFQLPSKYA